MLALLFAVALQASAAEDPDIIVTARVRREREIVSRQVDAMLPPMSFNQPLARFTDPVCPGVTGLSRASAQAVVDRIGIVANQVGLRVGAPGCTPNLLVVVTADGRGSVRRLIGQRPDNFRTQTLADIRRIVAEPGSARGWAEIETRGRDGDRADASPGGPPILSVQGSSRIALGFRRDIVSAVVVIDAAAVRGRDTVQIADYAALRALTDARPGRRIGRETILSVFTPTGDATAPKRLTELDCGILRGLYLGRGNVPSVVKRGTIVRGIVGSGSEPVD